MHKISFGNLSLQVGDGLILSTGAWSSSVVPKDKWTLSKPTATLSHSEQGMVIQTSSWSIHSGDFGHHLWKVSSDNASLASDEGETISYQTHFWNTTYHPPKEEVNLGVIPSSLPVKIREPLSNSKQPLPSANPKCHHCGKTVYPMELIKAVEKSWHKGCFRCRAEDCGNILHLHSFGSFAGNVFCKKHVPKGKPTSTAVSGNLLTKAAATAPKLNTQQGVQKDSTH